jgi:hypothetical protein
MSAAIVSQGYAMPSSDVLLIYRRYSDHTSTVESRTRRDDGYIVFGEPTASDIPESVEMMSVSSRSAP